MLPYVVVILVIIFLVLKLSGVLDEFTEAMRRRWEKRTDMGSLMLNDLSKEKRLEERLEVFKDFLEKTSEEDDLD